VLAPVTELAEQNKLTYAPKLRALGEEPLLTLAEKGRKKRLQQAAADRQEKAKAAKANGGNNIEALIQQAPRPAVAGPAAAAFIPAALIPGFQEAAAAAGPGVDANMGEEEDMGRDSEEEEDGDAEEEGED
jgi:hypothetical protein